jgi:hypothetical protein
MILITVYYDIIKIKCSYFYSGNMFNKLYFSSVLILLSALPFFNIAFLIICIAILFTHYTYYMTQNVNFTILKLFQLIWEDLDLTLEKSLAKTLVLPLLMSGGPSLAGTPSPSPSGSINGLAALALSHTGEREEMRKEGRRGQDRRVIEVRGGGRRE